MGIDIRYIERFARNLLTNWFSDGTDIQATPYDIAETCVKEWGLDIQDVATVMRILSGEATKHGVYE